MVVPLMPLAQPPVWPNGAPDTHSAHIILIEYLTFLHGETVSHAGLVRLLKNGYRWDDASQIEDTLASLEPAYDVVVKEEVFCCCAPVPCYHIRDECPSIRKIVDLLGNSPNKEALLALPHVKACL